MAKAQAGTARGQTEGPDHQLHHRLHHQDEAYGKQTNKCQNTWQVGKSGHRQVAKGKNQ